MGTCRITTVSRIFSRLIHGTGLVAILSSAVAAWSAESTDIPDWVLAGIAAVETRSLYRNGELVHYRDRRDGADGEVGPWQLSPAALSDLGVLNLRERIRREPVLAESMTRAWLLRCYRRTGDWLRAVAFFHTGPNGDAQRGRDYVERAYAAGTTAE
jgi:hypothetical protein